MKIANTFAYSWEISYAACLISPSTGFYGCLHFILDGWKCVRKDQSEDGHFLTCLKPNWGHKGEVRWWKS